mmetsp:Transcript_28587/g.40305  ORF Transcript_28587/g.40305 Transcript_28587/m.40305 type:complete len:95 (-) Transcript_28587:650-934(-)
MKPDAVFLAFRSKEITKRTIDKIIPLLPSEDIVIQAWGEKAMRWSWRRTVSIGFENDPQILDALLQESESLTKIVMNTDSVSAKQLTNLKELVE